MLDTIMKDYCREFSYDKVELDKRKKSANHLREIIKKENDFESSFIGGSHQRKTMVKGISDIDVYFKYVGDGNPQKALDDIRRCLKPHYPNAKIFQDKPCVLIHFKVIPINVTPYKEVGADYKIPDKKLLNWNHIIHIHKLDKDFNKLKGKDSGFIDLVKLLKIWNLNYRRNLENYKIEENVCALFLDDNNDDYNTLPKRFALFLKNNGFKKDAGKFTALMGKGQGIKKGWLDFIEKRT